MDVAGDFIFLFFETFLTLSFLSFFVFGSIINNSGFFFYERIVIFLYSLFFLVLVYSSFLLDIYSSTETVFILFGQVIIDGFSYYFKLMLLLFSSCFIIITINYVKFERFSLEFLFIFFISTLASFYLITACDFVSLYLALELQSLSFFLLTTINWKSNYGLEAGLKYFVLSSLASGIFLLGLLLLYLSGGSFNFFDICMYYNIVGAGGKFCDFFGVSFIFILVAFLFKFSIVPFHNWTFDVYEGASWLVLGIFSILSKISLFAVLVKLYFYFITKNFYFMWLIFILACCTIAVGSISAIYEGKVKRIFAASTIVNGGFMLLCLSFSSLEGFRNAYFYLFIYSVVLIGFFSVVLDYRFGKQICQYVHVEQFNSIFFSNSFLGYLLCMFFFSFAGLPPFFGFLVKFSILVQCGFFFSFILLFLFLVLTLLSYYFYLRFIRILFFNKLNYNYFYSNLATMSFWNSYIVSLSSFVQICFFIFFYYYYNLFNFCILIEFL